MNYYKEKLKSFSCKVEKRTELSTKWQKNNRFNLKFSTKVICTSIAYHQIAVKSLFDYRISQATNTFSLLFSFRGSCSKRELPSWVLCAAESCCCVFSWPVVVSALVKSTRIFQASGKGGAERISCGSSKMSTYIVSIYVCVCAW